MGKAREAEILDKQKRTKSLQSVFQKAVNPDKSRGKLEAREQKIYEKSAKRKEERFELFSVCFRFGFYVRSARSPHRRCRVSLLMVV